MSKKKKQEFRKSLELKLLTTFQLDKEGGSSKRVKKGIKKASKILSTILKDPSSASASFQSNDEVSEAI